MKFTESYNEKISLVVCVVLFIWTIVKMFQIVGGG